MYRIRGILEFKSLNYKKEVYKKKANVNKKHKTKTSVLKLELKVELKLFK